MKFNLKFSLTISLILILSFGISHTSSAQNQARELQIIQDTLAENPKYALRLIESQFDVFPNDSQSIWLSNLKGDAYVAIDNFDLAEIQYKKAIEKSKVYGDSVLLFQCRNHSALLQFKKGNYSGCFELYLENLKLGENSSNCNFQANAKLGVATMYYYLKDKEKCMKQFLECHEIAKSCNDTVIIQKSCHNISALYAEFEEKDKSIAWMEKGIKYIDPNDFAEFAHAYSILAAEMDYPEEKTRMIYLHNKSLEYARMTSDSGMVAFCSLKKSNYFILEQKLDSAYLYAKYSLEIYRKVKILDGILHANGYLSKIALLENDPIRAVKALKEYVAVTDSIYTEVSFLKASELETKYESAKKETENALLKKTNELKEAELEQEKSKKLQQALLFIGLILAILSFTVFLFYKRKLKTNKSIQELQKRNFNAVIEAEENERGRIAKELHDGLGQLLSSAKLNVAATEESVSQDDLPLIKTSMQLIDEAVSEVRSISHNLMPIAISEHGLKIALEDLAEKINNSNSIKIILSINDLGELLTKSTELTIYRVIQEVLNNALKHSKATEIHIELIDEKKSLSLNISDNGSGFDTRKIKSSKGIGWANIFSRISLINGKINVDSSKESGTHLSIQIPLA